LWVEFISDIAKKRGIENRDGGYRLAVQSNVV
jgi:hypothetical protein